MNAQQALGLAQKRIDDLQHLVDVQVALINEKNDEIARLTSALQHAQSHDYADDFDAEP